MPPGTSPKDDDERIYACPHCPKRYVRKDYLERHELNHTRPSSVCPACGKGFARPDVLRKHLFTSCKSRRTGDGDPPPPLTTAEEDALVPRKRRRPQRRLTIPGVNDTVPPLRMASHGHPAMTNGHRPVSAHARTHSHPHAAANPALGEGMDGLSRSHGHNNHHHGSHNHGHSHLPFHHHHHQGPHVHPPPDHQGFSVSPTPSDVTTESGAPGSSSGIPGQTSAYGAHHQPQYGNGSRLDHYRVVQRLSGPPASSPLDHHDPQSGMPLLSPQQSQPRYPQHLQHHQVPTPSQLPHGHPHPRAHQSPDHRLGPARAGGSLEVLLAPAFAATPETTFGFGFAAPKDGSDWQNANPPPHAGGLPHSLPPPHVAAGVHGGSGIQFEQQRNWAQPTAVDNNGLETSAGVAVQQGFGVAGLSPDLPVPTTTGDASSKTYSSTGNRGGARSRDNSVGFVSPYHATAPQPYASRHLSGDGIGAPSTFSRDATAERINSYNSDHDNRRFLDFGARDIAWNPATRAADNSEDNCSWLFDASSNAWTVRWSPVSSTTDQLKTPDHGSRITPLEAMDCATFSQPLDDPSVNSAMVTPAVKPRRLTPHPPSTSPPFPPHPEEELKGCGPCPLQVDASTARFVRTF